MRFVKTTKFEINLNEEQRKQLSSKERIEKALKDDNVLAFNIIKDDTLIGFAMFRKYSDSGYFLWNYAIDVEYQKLGYGTKALKELIDYLSIEYNVYEITTRVLWIRPFYFWYCRLSN